MKIDVLVHPNSKKPRIETDLLGTLRVYVSEPPLEGRANAAVAQALCRHFNVSKNSVALIAGHKSKIKRFEITGK